MNRLLLAVAVLAASVPVRAIELSLEENRAERGSVGYVDMQRLFKASPDAARAREGLEELVRQAEERVNVRKADLLRLNEDLSRLKSERETLAKSTPTVTVAPPPPPATAPVAAAPPPAASTVPVTEAPPSVAGSTEPITINLPGLTDGPLKLDRPGTSPMDPSRTAAAPAPTPTPAPVVAAGPSVSQRLMEFDGLIMGKQADINRVQAELDGERLGAEKNLVDAEGRKTDQVLAKLYRAITAVAKREGVSVVVDKATTLYGHPAVDLTDKILKQLNSPVTAQ
jgi:Skp family chaperone for outer membrane proteins